MSNHWEKLKLGDGGLGGSPLGHFVMRNDFEVCFHDKKLNKSISCIRTLIEVGSEFFKGPSDRIPFTNCR